MTLIKQTNFFRGGGGNDNRLCSKVQDVSVEACQCVNFQILHSLKHGKWAEIKDPPKCHVGLFFLGHPVLLDTRLSLCSLSGSSETVQFKKMHFLCTVATATLKSALISYVVFLIKFPSL